jgi:hypothetical protein
VVIPAALRHARKAATGQASEPRTIAILAVGRALAQRSVVPLNPEAIQEATGSQNRFMISDRYFGTLSGAVHWMLRKRC